MKAIPFRRHTIQMHPLNQIRCLISVYRRLLLLAVTVLTGPLSSPSCQAIEGGEPVQSRHSASVYQFVAGVLSMASTTNVDSIRSIASSQLGLPLNQVDISATAPPDEQLFSTSQLDGVRMRVRVYPSAIHINVDIPSEQLFNVGLQGRCLQFADFDPVLTGEGWHGFANIFPSIPSLRRYISPGAGERVIELVPQATGRPVDFKCIAHIAVRHQLAERGTQQ
jgi:hypothetical protein